MNRVTAIRNAVRPAPVKPSSQGCPPLSDNHEQLTLVNDGLPNICWKARTTTYCTQAVHSTTCVDSGGASKIRRSTSWTGLQAAEPFGSALQGPGTWHESRSRRRRSIQRPALPCTPSLSKLHTWMPSSQRLSPEPKGPWQIARHSHSLPPDRICIPRA